MTDTIAILDFGGQYAHLVANRIRRLGVYSEIVDALMPAQALKKYKGIILSGGPASVNDPESPHIDPDVYTLGIPILGLCYGHQITAYTLGGRVEKGKVREYGHTEVEFSDRSGIFEGVKSHEVVWMSHFDQVVALPSGFVLSAASEDCPVAAMVDPERQIYCMQFHPEVTHTACGMQILENFVRLTGAERAWNMERYLEELQGDIVRQVGEKHVFMLVSGGVDSSVAFMLLDRILGQGKVYGLFVDTGFMRMGEREMVEHSLRAAGVTDLHVYDGSHEFFAALAGVYDPEEKRRIIGALFLEIQRKVSHELQLNPEKWLLGQGTIYPDTIESGGTRRADTIKTHHNRVAEIQKLIEEGRVIEPLAQLYKDEVREVGEQLGLPHDMVWRHPFPGPGLAVRCLCTEHEQYPANYREIEEEAARILMGSGLSARVVPLKSVGVQGDERTYRHPIVLYGEPKNWGELTVLSTRLTNQLPEINRVVLGLSPDKFDDLTIQKSSLTPARILTTQKADKAVMDFIKEKNIEKDIWQFPTVLLPLQVDSEPGETVVLRPVCSTEAMTAHFYHMDMRLVSELVARLKGIEGISGVLYDITNKPPGTIEWE